MSTFWGAIFGQSKPPLTVDEQMKEWKRTVQREGRSMDRDIAKAQNEIKKAMSDCKALAKKKNEAAVKLMVKHVVKARQGVARMYMAKANLSAIQNEITAKQAMLKVQGCLSKSTEIMHNMNQVLKLPEISETMRALAREMTRAGLVDEMVQEAMSSMDADGLESDADEEVDRIYAELTAEVLVKAPAVATRSTEKGLAADTAAETDSDQIDPDIEAMNQRLQNL